MAEISVKVVRFFYNKPSAEWLMLCDKLSRAGMHLMQTREQNVAMPQAGVLYVNALDFNYVRSDTLETVWDFFAVVNRGTAAGYYLELPASCQPAPRDPSADYDGCAAESRHKQAVRWLCAVPGRTQQQAAEEFDLKQGNISVTMRRMRKNGEI